MQLTGNAIAGFVVAGLAVALTCLSAAPALARSSKPKAPRTPSSEERKTKEYTINVEPLLVSSSNDHSVTGMGASVGMFLDPDLIVRATYRGGFGTSAFSQNEKAVSAQLFLTNSFFVEAGVMRRIVIDHGPEMEEYEDPSARDEAFTYNVDTVGGLVAIGNQWQWGAFTLGARWAMGYAPRQARKATITENDPETFRTGENERDRLESLKVQGEYYLPALIVGWSF
jgi:hypothetical protein